MDDVDWVPVLKALADEHRLALVGCLLDGPRTVTELARISAQTHCNTSKHLRVLREAGIVESRREGRFHVSGIAKSFASAVDRKSRTLDLGCCLFRFPPCGGGGAGSSIFLGVWRRGARDLGLTKQESKKEFTLCLLRYPVRDKW